VGEESHYELIFIYFLVSWGWDDTKSTWYVEPSVMMSMEQLLKSELAGEAQVLGVNMSQ
jgi:hypothetical protein